MHGSFERYVHAHVDIILCDKGRDCLCRGSVGEL